MTPQPKIEEMPGLKATHQERSSDESRKACSICRGPYPYLVLVILACVIAYGPVLFNFFAGDDFVHLTWLSRAVKQPSLVWRNFYSSWLDGSTTRFYRPLISVFMLADYRLWGLNGLGFRATNLLFHCFSIFLVFAIARQLAARSDDKMDGKHWPASNLWGLLSAGLFALYPLHPEAVSWITGRVDAIVTTFCLLSLWSYLRYREDKHGWWRLLSGVAMIMALLSKEMAVTLPMIFLVYEFIFARSDDGRASKLAIFRPTAWSWAILIIYLLVRRCALGTMVGGYDDSLFFVANWHTFLGGWAHGLKMMLIPVNKELLGEHHFLTRLWEVLSMASLLLTVASLRLKRHRRLLSFIFLWLLLSLLPVYKLFAIADDLQGSRLAYLATVPLSMLIAFGFASLNPTTNEKKAWPIALSLISGITLLMAAGAILMENNQAWREAGKISNSIRQGLSKLYRQLPGDPPVLIVGLPDQYKGAYICRNALTGMTSRPQFPEDIKNALAVDRFEPILPFGFFKESLFQVRDKVKIYRWSPNKHTFLPIYLNDQPFNSKDRQSRSKTLDGKALLAVLSTPPNQKALFRLIDGRLLAQGAAGVNGRPAVVIDMKGIPCFLTDFISVDLKLLSSEGWQSPVGADILYANDSDPQMSLRRRVHASIEDIAGVRRLIFALRGLPDWALGGNCRALKLLLPDRVRVLIQSIAIVPKENVMPDLTFDNSGYLGSKGFIHLSRQHRSQIISINAQSIPGAESVELNITKPNLLFESQNAMTESSVIMSRLKYNHNRGQMVISLDQFPSTGLYEARLRSLDKQGNRVGVAGDHIVVSVDP